MSSAATFLERQALRLQVRWSRWSLDGRLAAGMDPTSDPALSVRAQQLRSARHRRSLAATLERLVRDSDAAQRPALSSAVPIVREQVSEARDSLLTVAHVLRHAKRVRVRGIALLQHLLTDAESVIYTDSARGAVELRVRAALQYLTADGDFAPQAAVWSSKAETLDVLGGSSRVEPHNALDPR